MLVDTIGVCTPEAAEFLVRWTRGWIGEDIPIHWHGHNDFGLATAIAIAAVRGGATWIHGTINGMGERAGNADIAEVALALHCLYDVPVGDEAGAYSRGVGVRAAGREVRAGRLEAADR